MKNTKLKKIVLTGLSVFVLLVAVLAVHIYMVTKPAADEHTKVMARLDFKQPIQPADASTITNWLYLQKGVEHVLCNPKTNIVVFTYYPEQNNADVIAANLKANLHYNLVRYKPTAADMQGGCPVAAGSATARIYSSISNILH